MSVIASKAPAYVLIDAWKAQLLRPQFLLWLNSATYSSFSFLINACLHPLEHRQASMSTKAVAFAYCFVAAPASAFH